MNPLWLNFCEHLKSRGAWLFMPALLLLIFLVIVCQYLFSAGNDFLRQEVIPNLPYALPGFLLLALCAWLVLGGARRDRRTSQHDSRMILSRDERLKARSKLMEGRKARNL